MFAICQIVSYIHLHDTDQEILTSVKRLKKVGLTTLVVVTCTIGLSKITYILFLFTTNLNMLRDVKYKTSAIFVRVC